MGWYIVKFENKNAVEPVPKSWSKNKKDCLWPPSHWSTTKINDYIKLEKPPEKDFVSYKAVILGSYDDLSVVLRKANKAKYTSDLSSQNYLFEKQRRSKQEKKKKYSAEHLSKVESSSSSCYESDNNNYPFPGTFISNDLLASNLPTKIVAKNKSTTDEDFQKHVLKELNVMHLKMNDIMESVALLLKNKKVQDDPTIIVNDIPSIVHLFPINNEQTLAEVEQWLNADVQNVKKLSMELSRIGGLNVKEVTKRIMYRVFTNEVGILYCWEGAKKKQPFKNLKIASVILGAVRYCKNTADSSEAEVISFIKAWLARCKNRMLNTKNDVATERNDGNDM